MITNTLTVFLAQLLLKPLLLEAMKVKASNKKGSMSRAWQLVEEAIASLPCFYSLSLFISFPLVAYFDLVIGRIPNMFINSATSRISLTICNELVFDDY